MPRGERPLESADSALLRFAADLRRLRERAGSPPYRSLGQRAHYSAATLSEAAGGRKLPSLAVTLAYAEACGGDLGEWEARWREVAADDAPAPAGESPYVGLAAFQSSDVDRFFGREKLTAKLVDLVRAQRFVGVFGASGSGKSSLLRAGLVPGIGTSAVVFTPGAHPLEECAVRLAGPMGVSAVELKAEFSADPANLHLRIRQFDEDLVLVVDQFEEVFTLASAERDWFVTALTGGPRVVIGVRADFYGHCGRYPELVEAVEGSQLLVGPMSSDELRRAITGPAERLGAKVETALVARLVADVAGQTAALPLVSHALVETWRRRRGMTLSLNGYEQAGGVEHAVARTAEEVFGTFSSDEQRQARLVFLRLIALGEGTEDTKRRVPRRELDVDDSLLGRLASARLVSLDRESVELTHEALIRSWPRLRDWIADDRDGLRVHRQLIDATDAWEAHDRDPDALYRGVRLAQAKDLGDVLTGREREFLDASVDLELAQQAATRRRSRRTKQLMGVLTVLVVLLTGAIVYAFRVQGIATDDRNIAYAMRAVQAADSFRETNPRQAAYLSLAAYRLAPIPDVRDSLLGNYAASGAKTSDSTFSDVVSLGPDQHVIAGKDPGAGPLLLWNITTDPRRTPQMLGFFGHDAVAAELGTGKAATTDYNGRAKLWNTEDPLHPRELAVLPRAANLVELAADGKIMATVDYRAHSLHDLRNREPVVLWDVTDPAHPAELGTFGEATGDVQLSADGRRAVTSSHVGLHVWDLTDPRNPRQIPSPVVAGSPSFTLNDSGDRLFIVGHKGVQSWGISSTGVEVHGDWGNDQNKSLPADISTDGHWLVSNGTESGTMSLWNVSDPTKPVLAGRVKQRVQGTIRFVPGTWRFLVHDQGMKYEWWDLDVERVAAQICTVWSTPEEPNWDQYFPGIPAARPCS